ncbi:molybdate ABC transporter substrate-binding protein [Geovibrio thiophilus]|uniref:Molybdate ABC transporter substrate-binding protein n=1 Tax=Geovibrio thiophilus TaxID=139438 RepID=A0A410JXL6_9BACT|nr:molybdate ABC transporter substrate-binding protein [Geovibrio thiophilus]QAR32922.1 molybdate ABC transporter substrate-binding protein [Geovibrio thiophilus]
MLKKLIIVTVVFVMSSWAFAADEVTVAAGAGYRKLVTEMAAYCEQKEGIKVNMSFGNLGQVIAQVKASGLIPVVIGDKNFFTRAKLEITEFQPIGKGKLVLAWRKGIDIASVDEIATDKIKRLAIPNTENAIYGIAGTQYMAGKGLTDKVKDKLLVVATVPQVNSYVATGEVDAGFSNLTDTMGIADKIGGYIEINEGYAEIPIVAAFLKESEGNAAALRLKNCLADAESAKIAKKHGL